jgi:hypothetical protein
MSEKKRQKKDGENRGNRVAKANNKTADRRQGVDRPNVKEPRGGDSYDRDLQKTSSKKRSVGTYVGERRADAAKRGWETRRKNQKNRRAA